MTIRDRSHLAGVRTQLSVAFLVFFVSHNVSAQQIQAEANGSNNAQDVDFWSVEFLAGPGNIQSVTFDLNPLGATTRFDFDGVGNFGGATMPVLGLLVDISNSDISASFDDLVSPGNPQRLIFDFAPGSFAPGESFRFSADVDNGHQNGAALAGAQFMVVLESAEQGVSSFVATAATVSQALVTIPEPATAFLLLAAAGSLFGRNGRRRNN